MTDDSGIVEIHGKSYLTVAKRIRDFRDDHPEYSIVTKILSAAELIQIKASIKDPTGRVIATGLAEEERGRTSILTTSALETCETSAVGRALAIFGYLGSHIASAEEMENALAQQKEQEGLERLQAHNRAVRDHIESIVAIKHYLLNDEYEAAYEAIAEIPDDDKRALWISSKSGGIWTTDERSAMKSNEWTAARKQHHGEQA